MSIVTAFGTWASPISAELVSTAGVKLGAVTHCAGAAFWAETRPQDDGRCTIVKATEGAEPVDLMAAPYNVRTRVHEYGGGAWWVDEQYLYFVHWNDQCLYRVAHNRNSANVGSKPEAITYPPASAQALRYADGCVTPDGQWVICVRESHSTESLHPTNDVVAIRNSSVTEERENSRSDTSQNANSNTVRVLAQGADFYSTPRISPDGKYLCWIEWMHPQMPWDGTSLKVGLLDDAMTLQNVVSIAGNHNIAIMDATWASASEIIYTSDESGWWNLYAHDMNRCNSNLEKSARTERKQLTHFTDQEVGTPAWVFGTQRFVVLKKPALAKPGQTANNQASNEAHSEVSLAMVVTAKAKDALVVRDPSGALKRIDTPFSTIHSIAADDNGGVVVHGQPETDQASIVGIHVSSTHPETTVTTLRAAESLDFDRGWLSTAKAISFASQDREAHAFYYAPTAPDHKGIAGELPPLIVMGHGGPTSHTNDGLKLAIQYWTSRGIAVVDVNYGGSSGFGREYRRLLNAQWGIVDVQDCVAAADYLAQQKQVDAKRMVIRGGSAGGLTVLRALQTSRSFAAGTSLYGVTDLALLAGDTHKFESRYLDGLLGGAYPEHKAIYEARSPINHTQDLDCPILVLQGDEDKVVPPNQSAAIVEAAAAKGLPHAYILFAGEQHGFRKSENVIRALQIELWFYSRVLGFEPADRISAPPEAVGL